MNGVMGWIAAGATALAAVMTAANLGARTTGWGFVIFTLGSIAWVLFGWFHGQWHLVFTNGFLAVVNLVGVWRWLGRQSTYEAGGRRAARASRRSASPTLFPATGVTNIEVLSRDDARLGMVVEALLRCADARVSYVVVRGEDRELRAIPGQQLRFTAGRCVLTADATWFYAQPALNGDMWPAEVAPTDSALPGQTSQP